MIFYILTQIFANLLSYGILYGEKRAQNNSLATNSTKPDFSTCGIHDCQNPNATQENINNYVPASEATLYTVIGVMAGLILIAGIVYLAMVKDIDPSLECRNPETTELDSYVDSSE